MKKILCIICILLCIGCTQTKPEKIKTSNGKSKTYQFFKNFDIECYYISFFDRNVSKNDNTKIIMARDKEKYYYEIDGESRRVIIQKDNIKYTLNYNNKTYSKTESSIEDYTKGIIPKDIDKLKTEGYEKGKEKVYGNYYEYEKYKNENENSIYYFSNDKLKYIKYENALRSVMLKFNETKKKYDKKIFDINSDFTEITY